MNPRFRSRLKKVVYVATLVGIVTFLIFRGTEPWKSAFACWPVMLGVMLLSPLALMVQVIAFRYCIPSDIPVPPLLRLTRIWAIASISSIIAPFIAGLAVRVTLLKQEGLDIRTSSIATVRQTWINVEYAWVAASFLLMFYPWPEFPSLGYISVTGWLSFKLLCALVPFCNIRIPRYLEIFTHKLPRLTRKAKLWQWGQIIIMTINYWVVFWLGGAPLAWHNCLLLTAVTILASLLIFIPQGLGVLDSLWVWIASQQGMSLNEGVALAITMRLGVFIGTAIVYIVLSLYDHYFPSTK